MKQLILTVATTLVLFACNNKPDPGVAAQKARQAAIDSMTAVESKKAAAKKAHEEHYSAAALLLLQQRLPLRRKDGVIQLKVR
jgi:hypothetical protein